MSEILPKVGSVWLSDNLTRMTVKEISWKRPPYQRDACHHVLLRYTIGEIDLPLATFQARCRPLAPEPTAAPPASRWLDPASVPCGPPMRVCSKDCPFPSRQPKGPGALCAYCACKVTYVSPRVESSVLTPAPRWRTLSKEWLYPSTPRIPTVTTRWGSNAPTGFLRMDFRAPPKTPRAFRVRALGDSFGRDPSLLAAKWVRA